MELHGMSLQEFSKLYHQIMENNSWKAHLEQHLENVEKRPMIKYVSFCMDTRDGDIYSITLEPFSKDKLHFRLDAQEGRAALQNYLNGDEGRKTKQ